MQVYIFKTNIPSQEKAKALDVLINKHEGIHRWTIDTEDIDKVLRIETNIQLAENEFMSGVRNAGFACEVLPY